MATQENTTQQQQDKPIPIGALETIGYGSEQELKSAEPKLYELCKKINLLSMEELDLFEKQVARIIAKKLSPQEKKQQMNALKNFCTTKTRLPKDFDLRRKEFADILLLQFPKELELLNFAVKCETIPEYESRRRSFGVRAWKTHMRKVLAEEVQS